MMTDVTTEFSRLINVSRIAPKGVEEQLEAKPAERAALAERFDLIDLATLTAELSLIPGANQSVAITGSIKASFTQRCVVTLEPIATDLNLTVDMVCLPAEAVNEEELISQQEDLDDEVDLYTGGKIDIGELVSQQLGINIDPYPRKADAALPVTEVGARIEKKRPFANLMTVVNHKKNNEKH